VKREPLVIVCVPLSTPLHYPDNLVGTCRDCGGSVQYRPHVPAFDALLCLDCWQRVAQPGDRIIVTARTLAEVAAWRRRN
jgi:hypothetical protein